MTKIYETDPRFTAYLLGELPAEEAKEVERLLGEHPADAAEWEKTRDLIAQLAETLENEAIPEPVAENPPIFKEKPKMDTNKTNEPKKRRWLWRLSGVAAMLAVAVGLAMYATNTNWRMLSDSSGRFSYYGEPLGAPPRSAASDDAYLVSADFGSADAESLAASPNEKLRKNRENSRYAENLVEDEEAPDDMDMMEENVVMTEKQVRADLGMNKYESMHGFPDTPERIIIQSYAEQVAPLAEEPAPAIVEVEPMGIDGNMAASDVGTKIANFSGSGSGMGMRKPAERARLAGLYRGAQEEESLEVVYHDHIHGLGSTTTKSDSSASGGTTHHHHGGDNDEPEELSVVTGGEEQKQFLAGRATVTPEPGLGPGASPMGLEGARRKVPADPHAGMKDETYKAFIENVFEDPAAKPFSTFGIDVDSASYTVMRQYLNDRNAKPPAQSVRVEEYINYFKYALAPPAAEDKTPFAVKTDLFAHPWQDGLMMMKITLKGKEMAKDTRPPLNLVFLLDVSGSMSSWNRLPLVKSSMIELLDELTERDRVAIVTYANGTQVNLTPTAVTDDGRHEIAKVINALNASGGTSGGAGLKLAYAEAKKNFNGEAVNRIVLCTDGDFNIGETGDPAMEEIVSQGAKTGVFLTVLGFGMGNYKDARLKLLSDKGNGNYGYIDTAEEARRLLVENLSGTMITIAKDVKIQLDFNPKYVAAYRLIGYENRKMAAKDFHDDKKDSGEIGAGHTVTALYELVPRGIRIPRVEPVSRYSEDAAAEQPEEEVIEPGEMLTVALRYKMPDSEASTLMEFKQSSPESLDTLPRMDTESHFASAVALYAMLLRQSEYTGSATLDTVLELAQPGVGDSAARKEFVELVKTAKTR